MPTDVPQNNEARMSMLRECVLYVVKKGTIPMDVQQSVRRLDSMILDYTVSSVEKTDILPVGVKKKKMIINSRIEVHEDLRGDTRPQVRKKQPSSIQITLSRYEGCSSKDVSTKLWKEWKLKEELD